MKGRGRGVIVLIGRNTVADGGCQNEYFEGGTWLAASLGCYVVLLLCIVLTSHHGFYFATARVNCTERGAGIPRLVQCGSDRILGKLLQSGIECRINSQTAPENNIVRRKVTELCAQCGVSGEGTIEIFFNVLDEIWSHLAWCYLGYLLDLDGFGLGLLRLVHSYIIQLLHLIQDHVSALNRAVRIKVRRVVIGNSDNGGEECGFIKRKLGGLLAKEGFGCLLDAIATLA